MKLRENILSRYIGTKATNYNGELMGVIIDFIYDKTGSIAQYIVLETNEIFGRKTRHFAIPITEQFLKITGKSVMINANKNEMKLAKGIAAKKCPVPIFEIAPLIYELFNYNLQKNKEKDFNNFVAG